MDGDGHVNELLVKAGCNGSVKDKVSRQTSCNIYSVTVHGWNKEGRTPLHYSSTMDDDGHLYKLPVNGAGCCEGKDKDLLNSLYEELWNME